MKITKKTNVTAATLDELRKQKEDYDAELKSMNAEEERQYSAFNKADREVSQMIEKKISDEIGPTSVQLSIKVDPYGSRHLLGRGWGVRINCNDNKKFEKDVALVWNWDASIGKDGEVEKESGSWSGLSAVTPEQMSDLEESVRILKILNNMDWKAILSTPMPAREDYIDDEFTKLLYKKTKERPDFEKQIADEELRDLIGTNTAVRLSKDQYYNGQPWMLITSMTDKFVKGYIFSDYDLRSGKTAENLRQPYYERRVSKDNIKGIYNGDFETMNIPVDNTF